MLSGAAACGQSHLQSGCAVWLRQKTMNGEQAPGWVSVVQRVCWQEGQLANE